VSGTIQRATLSPPASFTVELVTLPNATRVAVCTPPLPACQTASAIDVSDITAALANNDLNEAFGQVSSPQYNDPDELGFLISRASDDRSIRSGGSCTVGTADCKAMPEGVRVFMTLMRDLLKQQLADASCASVRQP
jgi:hypothetical protein